MIFYLSTWKCGQKENLGVLECCDFKETLHPDSKLEKPLCTVFKLIWLFVCAGHLCSRLSCIVFFVLWARVIYCCKECYIKWGTNWNTVIMVLPKPSFFVKPYTWTCKIQNRHPSYCIVSLFNVLLSIYCTICSQSQQHGYVSFQALYWQTIQVWDLLCGTLVLKNVFQNT